MHARLFCRTGQLAGANYEIKGEATIGKGPENSIQLYPGLVSSKHARIFFDKASNHFYIEDLKSRNGTRIDGSRVTGKEKLNDLQIITFADRFDFIFQVVSEESGTAARVSPSQEKPMPVAKPVAEPEPRLVKPSAVPPAQPGRGEEADRQKTMIDNVFTPAPVFGASQSADKKPPPDARDKTVIGDEFSALPNFGGPKPKPEPKPAPVVGKTVFDDAFVPSPEFVKQQRKTAEPVAPVQPQQKEIPPQPPLFALEVVDVKGGTSTFVLKQGENSIGRASTCDIPIEDTSLSRNHACITVARDTVKIRDAGSKNFTYVNGKIISSEVEIQPGTVLAFGMVKAKLTRKA